MEAIEKIDRGVAHLEKGPGGQGVMVRPKMNLESIANKVDELVDRVNQLAKPILLLRVSGSMIRRWEGDPQPLLEKMRTDVTEMVKDEYHVLCTVDDFGGPGLTFEIHNQQTEIAKTLIVQLENFKMPIENGEQD